MASVITSFDPDEERLAVIHECMQNHDVGDPDAEWPNNLLSRRAVVYGSGVIAREGVVPTHAVDADELARCKALSAEAAAILAGVDVGMGSEASSPFLAFFVAANVGEPVPSSITEALVRAKFGGTIFPLLSITVEPLEEAGVWWSEIAGDGEADPAVVGAWRRLMAWSRAQGFVDTRFVRIGDARELEDLPEEEWPDGTELPGCVFPRLVLGLTPQGSLVGLFGHCVES